MSDLIEIRQRLDRLNQLGNRMREQFSRLSGPEGEGMKKKAKEEGTRLGISLFGLIVAAVAFVYVLGVVILLVDIGLQRLWLSALIVVVGFLIIGGAVLAVGAVMAESSAKKLSKTTEDVRKQMKQVGEEMKTEVEELQKAVKREAEERQRQMTEMVKTVKAAAPAVAPVAVGAYLGYRMLKRAMRLRRERRVILKAIEMYEEARTGSSE